MLAKKVISTTDERVKLGQVLPLATPFCLMIGANDICNFKCVYCEQSNRPLELGRKSLSWELFCKCIEGAKKFPSKIKLIVIAGLGEPLLHPKIAEMVDYIKKSNITDNIRIITNASMLSHEVSDKLIKSNLDSLKISIQGVTSDRYYEMCGIKLSLQKLIDNITYFYQHKNHTVMDIKIVSQALDRGEEKIFFNMFGNICDTIHIENIVPISEGVDFGKLNIDKEQSQFSNNVIKNNICQFPFFYLTMTPYGQVIPCCHMRFSYPDDIVMENIANKDLAEIWTSKRMQAYRLMHLQGLAKKSSCYSCIQPQVSCHPEDNIDEYVDKLIKQYNELFVRASD